MTPSQQQEIETIIAASKRFGDRFAAGEIDHEALHSDPVGIVAEHGITIHPNNHARFIEDMRDVVTRHKAVAAGALGVSAVGASTAGCAACEAGLTAVFGALIILTVAAVVTAIVVFAPEVAAEAAIAFLENTAAVKIVLGIIMLGAAALATLVCTKLIKAC